MEEIFKAWGIEYDPNNTKNEMWMYVEIKSIYGRNGTMS